jgi:tetratricopeptide (TPR) repeat protein
MIRIVCFAVALLIAAPLLGAAEPDFDAQMRQAAEELQALGPACEKLMNDGDLAGANAKLLAFFPEGSRTPAQSFLLGNLLFEIDRRQSYALHKAADAAEPGNPLVIWEWALEQHRAGEYAGALASYQTYSKARPRTAVSYALQADCLLRLNRIDEAADAWRQSEREPDGSIEMMEDMVCAVHREPAPYQRRAELLAKATKDRDAGAAADLIALDCAFPFDWWHDEPHRPYLAHDAPVVATALKLPADDVRARAIACAADCGAADRDDARAIGEILKKHRLLTDADRTVPTHPGLLAFIATTAARAKAIDEEPLRKEIAPKVLELARKGHDARVWGLAVVIAPPADKPDEQLKLLRDAWAAAPDPRFAAGVLFLKTQGGQLTGDDRDLTAALKQFPESGLIWRAAYETAAREGKVTRPLLASAARAEFTHFTSFVAPATVVNRPRSNYLRGYFAQLLRTPPTTQPGKP